jgi:hypothetical protein
MTSSKDVSLSVLKTMYQMSMQTSVASRLPAVIRDPLVFLIDVKPTRVRQDLIAAGIADGEAASVTTGAPFWDMEDFGLDNFR